MTLTRKLTALLAALAAVALCAGCAKDSANMVAVDEDARNALAQRAGAPLFDGMGDHSHPITTSDPDAQRYFDQGLVIDFGFNHAESARSFRAAQTLDPECAMCFWGEALALGPNINVTSNGKVVMADDDRQTAYAAIQKALALAGGASQKERDYIEALAVRYNGDPSTAREPLDEAYASAMAALYARYPDDDDAAALYAESLMNTMPWDYWTEEQNPKPRTKDVINALERVLERNPRHPMAIHLYIHAVEASDSPGRAEGPADILRDLVPGSGHLVHMPSHIYYRIGRYADASRANVLAAAVDEAYIAACNAQGFYPASYYPHNIHFLWASASMEGRSAVAIEAGEKGAANNVRLEMIEEFPGVEFFKTIPLCSRWSSLVVGMTCLRHNGTAGKPRVFETAIWHYARVHRLRTATGTRSHAARAEQRGSSLALKTAYRRRVPGHDSVPRNDVARDIADSLASGRNCDDRRLVMTRLPSNTLRTCGSCAG